MIRAPLVCTGHSPNGICHAPLESREAFLGCPRCGAVYAVIDSIPQFVPPAIDDDELVERYYETHYGRFLRPRPQASVDELVPVIAWTDAFYERVRDMCTACLSADARVLDVGCALGRMTGELARVVRGLVIGMDARPRAVAEAARILRARDPSPITLAAPDGSRVSAVIDLGWGLESVGFFAGDALRLPLANASFDLVTCLNVLDRVADPRLLVAEVDRVVVTGGQVVVANPSHWDERFTPRALWVENVATLFDQSRWRQEDAIDAIPFAVRPHSRRVVVYANQCTRWRKIACGEGG